MKSISKIFITGGLGYLGSKLAQRVIAEGYRAAIFDSLVYGQNAKPILDQIRKGSQKLSVDFILGDTRNKKFLESAIREYSPGIVFHFGELVGVYACENNPPLTRDINYNGSKNVVDACSSLNIPLVYNSSSSVYGNQESGKLMKENNLLPRPSDYYCRFKLMVERYIADKLKKNHKFRAIVLRPATICGPAPRMRLELLPNHFTYCAIEKKRLKVAQPNTYRAIMDIDDLIDAYMMIVDRGGLKSGLYNVGHYNISKIDCARRVKKIFPFEIIMGGSVGDNRDLKINCSKFKKEYHWRPKISFEKSVKNIAKWISKNNKEIVRNKYADVINMPLKKWLEII